MRVGPLAARAVLKVAREVRKTSGGDRPLAVGGARELVPLLAKELRHGGDPAAVVENGAPERSAALVWIGAADEKALREAFRAGVPIVGVTEGESLPYAFDTNLVRVAPGQRLLAAEVVVVLARVLGEGGAGLAARLPSLREAVVDELIRSTARRNGLIGAAVFVPGVDLPALTLNQLRMVLRIAIACGKDVDSSRLPDVAGVVGAAFGLRAVARELLDLVPLAGWALKGGVAYSGTRAIGEAARRRFA